MNVVAAIEVDLTETPLGTYSRCADELEGVPVLRRTTERLLQARQLAGIHVLCPSDQVSRGSRLVETERVKVWSHDLGVPPWRTLVRSARKWSLDGWRGGIGGTTTFDEYTDPRVLRHLLRHVQADAVLSVPPTAAFVDPDLADRMIAHRRAIGDEARMVLTQAPPGLAGILLDRSLVEELGEKGIPIGWLVSYKPDAPQKDVIFTSCCLDAIAQVRHAVGRLIADTDTAVHTMKDLAARYANPDARTITTWMAERERTFVRPLPYEIEIELTTNSPFDELLLHPRGSTVPRRGPIDIEIIEKLVVELGRFDDSLVVLGGFGEPLRHPRFAEVLRALRPDGCSRGVYGLAVRTHLVDLASEDIDALIELGVDVLEVPLDAWSPQLYTALHTRGGTSVGNLEARLEAIDRLTERREAANSATPIIVPSLTKSQMNVHELDDFHDGWLRRLGAVAIHGYSHRARQQADLGVIRMTPPTRIPCRRLNARCLVLADGSVTLCDQDFKGLAPAGTLREQSLESIWRGQKYNTIREAHRDGRWVGPALCGSCDEWHRP